ncbi:transporter substrate-binding domain-containing protein [Haematospirillum jordaniae]|uniref:transporter substrate-binding domain-containing protein n=1 Tax=Haematospirillum jordaniae TaxID=1549855 RepID=UPI001ADE89D0|nr:transporter substrate-binding domain-containing protein [Haematospirillum jordaniae]
MRKLARRALAGLSWVNLAVISGIVSSLCFPASTRADRLSEIRAAGTITVATEMHYAPFDMLVDGQYQGLCKDLFDEVAKDLGVSVRYVDLPWPSILPGLDAGKFDFVNAPVTITPERAKRYAFTLPIGDATVSLLKQAGNEAIKTPNDIVGLTVGAQKGSAELTQLKALGTSLGGVRIREYVNIDEALADLGTGRIQAVANALPLQAYAARQRPDRFEMVLPSFGKPGHFAWLGRRDADSESLIEAVNTALMRMHEDGRLDAINTRWLGTAPRLPRVMPQP